MTQQQLQQQQHQHGLTLNEMLKSIDEYYECWSCNIDFDQAVREEQRKEYFKRIFRELAARFIDKKIKPGGPPLSYCDLADLFMGYVQQLPAEERKVRIEDLQRVSDPKKHLAGRLAKFLDAPEENHLLMQTQKSRQMRLKLVPHH